MNRDLRLQEAISKGLKIEKEKKQALREQLMNEHARWLDFGIWKDITEAASEGKNRVFYSRQDFAYETLCARQSAAEMIKGLNCRLLNLNGLLQGLEISWDT